MTAADPIPAIREEDATGEIADIFADLRRTLGVPFVNLIWRHVATVPGGLAWTWGLLKPVYLAPELGACAAALRARVRLPGLTPLPAFVCDCAGVGAAERETIATLIRDYNRANAVNFLALLVARSVLRGEPAPAAPLRRSEFAPMAASPAGGPPPRLLGLDELAPPLLALVRAFDRFGRLGESEGIASLYRHLAHWPPFMAVAYAAIRPADESGALASAQRDVIAAGEEQAERVLRPLLHGEPPPLGEPERQRILAGLDEFTRLMIGRMIVMGTALGSLLPNPD